MIKPSVDYRQFRFSKLNTPEFSHVWLLLSGPFSASAFSYVERFYPVAHYINMHCALDDLIPFNEWFLIPYLFWFVYLIGAVAYTFFFDVPGFRRMMRFVMITYSVTLHYLFSLPTCQMLRPEVLPARQCPHALHRRVLRVRHEHERLPVAACHRLDGGIFSLSGMRPSSPKRGWRIASTAQHFLSAFPTVFMKPALPFWMSPQPSRCARSAIILPIVERRKNPQRRAGCHPIRNFIRRSSDRFCGCFFYTALFPFSFAYIRA